MAKSEHDHNPVFKSIERTGNIIEAILMNARWALVVAYAGITFSLGSFIIYSVYHSIAFAIELWTGDEAAATVGMLSGLDGIMIANVVYLISAGSYIVYVRDILDDLSFKHANNRPQALRHLSPGALKSKMAAGLIGVSSVNLLQLFIGVGVTKSEGGDIDWVTFVLKLSIHVLLLAGLIVFAWVNHKDAITHAADGASHGNESHGSEDTTKAPSTEHQPENHPAEHTTTEGHASA